MTRPSGIRPVIIRPTMTAADRRLCADRLALLAAELPAVLLASLASAAAAKPALAAKPATVTLTRRDPAGAVVERRRVTCLTIIQQARLRRALRRRLARAALSLTISTILLLTLAGVAALAVAALPASSTAGASS